VDFSENKMRIELWFYLWIMLFQTFWHLQWHIRVHKYLLCRLFHWHHINPILVINFCIMVAAKEIQSWQNCSNLTRNCTWTWTFIYVPHIIMEIKDIRVSKPWEQKSWYNFLKQTFSPSAFFFSCGWVAWIAHTHLTLEFHILAPVWYTPHQHISSLRQLGCFL
jgi:hypothetical protein